LLGLAGSASLGLTMMACYGAPCTSDAKCAVPPPDANSDTTPDGGSLS
jgi:hypothetical protein